MVDLEEEPAMGEVIPLQKSMMIELLVLTVVESLMIQQPRDIFHTVKKSKKTCRCVWVLQEGDEERYYDTKLILSKE